MDARELTADVEVRRHNGQCGYGPWMMADDEDTPSWVADLIADAIADEGAESGIVSRGGSGWAWRHVAYREG